MNKSVLVLFAALMLGVAQAQPALQRESLQDLLVSPSWKTYLQALVPCQRSYENVYFPLEWVRVDLLDLKVFRSHVREAVVKWESLGQKYRSRELLEKQRSVSCDINRALKGLVDKRAKEKKISLLGTSAEVLRSIPGELRLALTPVDALFLNTHEVGKKIAADLKTMPQMNLESVTVDSKNKIFIFEGKPAAWLHLKIPSKKYYKLESLRSDNGVWSFRGRGIDKGTLVGADVKIREDRLIGGIFNQKNMERYPLGYYPRDQNLWVDESGFSHFHGDGHQHDR